MSAGMLSVSGPLRRSWPRHRTAHMTPIYMRVYNPALGKWAVACCEQPDPDGAPSRSGAAVRWTHDPAVATVLESHAAEALAEALVGISRKLGLGWDQVYAERTR